MNDTSGVQAELAASERRRVLVWHLADRIMEVMRPFLHWHLVLARNEEVIRADLVDLLTTELAEEAGP